MNRSQLTTALLSTTILTTSLFTTGCDQPAKDIAQAEAAQEKPQASLPLAISENKHRSANNQARDQYRNPQATLEFFEVQPNSTVVEIWPGGGWYTEVLAPLLPEGKLIAAHWGDDSEVGFFRRSFANYKAKLAQSPKVYSNVELSRLEPPKYTQMADDNVADVVLTFRNVHNWMRNQQEWKVFESAFNALKPGGILGVVEHRAPESFSIQQMIDSGYVSESYVKQLAEKAGFEFVEASEINANAKDTKDHPKGVWTLPPSLRLGEQDKEKYLSIGESDRMTLKFRKPLSS